LTASGLAAGDIARNLEKLRKELKQSAIAVDLLYKETKDIPVRTNHPV